MIYGIGVDILDISRLSWLSGKLDDPFIQKTYTTRECTASMMRTDPINYLAERFAAKEAVFKALRIESDTFNLNEIETLNDQLGRPNINLYGKTKEVMEEEGIKCISISLSYDNNLVIAFAVCET